HPQRPPLPRGPLDGCGYGEVRQALWSRLPQNRHGCRKDFTQLNFGCLRLIRRGWTDLNHDIAVSLGPKLEKVLVHHDRLQQAPQIAGVKTIAEARTTRPSRVDRVVADQAGITTRGGTPYLQTLHGALATDVIFDLDHARRLSLCQVIPVQDHGAFKNLVELDIASGRRLRSSGHCFSLKVLDVHSQGV